MAPQGDLSLARLIPAFVDELTRRECAERSPVTGGTAYVNLRYRYSHEQNRVLLTEAVPWAVAVADADRELGGRGVTHRRVDWLGGRPDDVPADDGWQLSRTVHLALPGALRGDPGEAHEVSFEQVRPALFADWQESLPSADPAVANDLTDRRRRTAEVCRLSWHATLLDGEVVSFCDLRLLEVGGHLLAQVEDVTTPTAHRGHGLAGQVVAHAVHAAWAAGAELVWLEADADDWPREWYARMGFVESGGESFNATRLAAG